MLKVAVLSPKRRSAGFLTGEEDLSRAIRSTCSSISRGRLLSSTITKKVLRRNAKVRHRAVPPRKNRIAPQSGMVRGAGVEDELIKNGRSAFPKLYLAPDVKANQNRRSRKLLASLRLLTGRLP